MKKIKNCKHCYEQFEARRSNHVYCTNSCKTKASYKRNDYKYVSGHYQKEEAGLKVPDKNTLNNSVVLEEKLAAIEKKISGVNLDSVKSTMIGTVAADSISYGVKKAFMPNTLPATKNDILLLNEEIKQIKRLMFELKYGGKASIK
ncbi:hypothetical protein [Algibacter lectus]|uniref:hypothetical protein n=1 Tax=Algibacter lectus TaxID=221126 RepID=UPI0026E91D2D|nr:hypothetical protein [Algibacter lectus]MDO7138152.1 hypothetical protein [Algibacter lectus]